MYLLLFSFSYAWGLFQALFKLLVESNKIQSVFSEDGFLLNLLLSLGWIPLGGESRFLYLLSGDN